MSTYAELTEDTLSYLYGFTTIQDQATYLTADIDDNDLTLSVADGSSLSRGAVEIGNETVWIDSVDTTTNVATVPPYGRGYRGSTAAAHTSGSRVASSPLFPRRLIAKALNEAIRSVYPTLFGVGSTTFTFNPAITTYALPAGAQSILSVTWESIGPSREWMPIRRYSIDSSADTVAFPTGASVSLYDAIVPGRTVSVTYAKVPTALSADGDDFATVTGLPASSEDVIRLAAAARMVPFLDAPHMSGLTAEADYSSNQNPVGAAATLGRFLLQNYKLRLDEEASRLQALYPARSYYTR